MAASPPVAGIRKISVPAPVVKRIVPSEFHDPPAAKASVNVFADPPSMSIRLRFPSAKNPMERLSGDQNGSCALSVPASGCAETESTARTHNWDRPSDTASKTIFCPSGEIARERADEGGGVVISRRASAAGAVGRKANTLETTAITVTSASAEIQARRSTRGGPLGCGASSRPLCASSISMRASRKSRRRSFSSFRRQRLSRRRIASGVPAGRRFQSGSVLKMPPRISPIVSPSKRARPVSIS